jgi:uncharacterized protein
MMTLFFAAVTMGMIGSFHCIGMCGPLACALPLGGASDLAKFTGTLLYNAGRIITYSALGLLFGIAGKSFSMLGFQQGLSITLGVIILIVLVIPKKWLRLGGNFPLAAGFTQVIRRKLGALFLSQQKRSLVAIGLLNGLLPCGLIYMAIAGAIASADPFKSAFFMASFGLGTLPVMWSVSFFGNYLGVGVRQKIRAAYPVMMAVMACLLIVRGMSLGIPHLSPGKNPANTIEHCFPATGNANTSIK